MAAKGWGCEFAELRPQFVGRGADGLDRRGGREAQLTPVTVRVDDGGQAGALRTHNGLR